tara:strand:+ start:31447 stop:32121 length:675 start_codon:yes stop_codon:yes gene_type:complete
MKRQRGRGRKPNNPGNRSYESNGPDVKIRGNANQIYEKYLQYGRDAQTSGDRIAAEAYFQHAEHYFRIMAANMPKDRLPQNQDDQDGRDEDDDNRNEDRSDDDSDNSGSDNNSRSENNRSERSGRSPRRSGRSDGDNMKVVDGDGESPDEIAAENGEERDSAPRRRRPRRRSTEKSDNSGSDEQSESKSSDNESSENDSADDDSGLKAMMARSGAEGPAEPVDS